MEVGILLNSHFLQNILWYFQQQWPHTSTLLNYFQPQGRKDGQ